MSPKFELWLTEASVIPLQGTQSPGYLLLTLPAFCPVCRKQNGRPRVAGCSTDNGRVAFFIVHLPYSCAIECVSHTLLLPILSPAIILSSYSIAKYLPIMRDSQVAATKCCFSLLLAGTMRWQLKWGGADVVHTGGHEQARATALPVFNLIQMTVVLPFAHLHQVKLSSLFIKLISSYMLIFSLAFCISLILKYHFDLNDLCAEVFR